MSKELEEKPAAVFVGISTICVGIGAALAYACDEPLGMGFGTDFSAAAPVWTVAALSYGINWLASIPAIIWQTEKFFDLTGSITYISLVIYSLVASGNYSTREVVLSSMALVWALRLGTFLVRRVHSAGKDGRFDTIKTNPVRFWNVWTIQGLWVLLTALPIFIVNASASDKALCAQDFVGFAVWGLGFICEAVSDAQKTAFNGDPANKGKWIAVGLWKYSRHPNYFGEIVLWLGVFISSTSVLTGSQWVAVISPLFVMFLLMKVSGVPGLEARADKKWGTDPEYRRYKAATSVLIPMPLRQVNDSDLQDNLVAGDAAAMTGEAGPAKV